MSWPSFWKEKNWQSYALWPLSKLVCWEAKRRYQKFTQNAQLSNNPLSTPPKTTIIVVGNVVVGGTGKTPFIIWLCKNLQAQGLKVGILSRGYGTKITKPIIVDGSQNAQECGDEPLMLHKQTGATVAVYPKRSRALECLMAHENVDIVISDDGLQHYGLARDIEVVLIDAQRQFGNGWCMPAGPLRESISRIADVDFTVWNGLQDQDAIPTLEVKQKKAFKMQLEPVNFCQVGNPETKLSVAAFLNAYPLKQAFAIAGIGNPQRFFETLAGLGLTTKTETFADHYAYEAKDLQALKAQNESFVTKPLIMTEKDAVKCEQFANKQTHWWYLQVETRCNEQLVTEIIQSHQNKLNH